MGSTPTLFRQPLGARDDSAAHRRRAATNGPEPREEAARPASRRLLIVLMNTDPRNVAELGAPFYHAAIAAAMDYEVDVLCTAAAGTLMHKG